jgi:hypothetical protein
MLGNFRSADHFHYALWLPAVYFLYSPDEIASHFNAVLGKTQDFAEDGCNQTMCSE